MATIEHPMIGSIDNNSAAVVKTNHVSVMSPEDEARAAQSFAESNLTPEIEAVVNRKIAEDPVIANDEKKRKSLDSILFLGKPHTSKVKLGDNIFIIKIINGIESDEIFDQMLSMDSVQRLAKSARLTLSHSIVSIDGVPFEDFYEGEDKTLKTIQRKYHVISTWPSNIINKLFRAYETMVDTFDSEYSVDFLGKSPKATVTG